MRAHLQVFWIVLSGILGGLALPRAADAEPLTHTWTTTTDFQGGTSLVNVNAMDVADQLQLNLEDLATPYLWVSNSASDTVAQIDTATGHVLRVVALPAGSDPSRTAVDLDFNCWVALRQTPGKAYKVLAETGALVGPSVDIGSKARGVAVTLDGFVWVGASMGAEGGFHWRKLDPQTQAVVAALDDDLGCYGIAINPFGKMFSTTSWLGGQSVSRFDAGSGEREQRWYVTHLGGDVYGIATDPDGNLWGTIWTNEYVVWVDGEHQCTDGAPSCIITQGDGVLADINVSGVLAAAGATNPTNAGGRGITVAYGAAWAVFNTNLGSWTGAESWLVQIDATSGEPLSAIQVGTGAVGVAADGDGYLWVVNYSGGGPGYQDLQCPDGSPGSAWTGSVTRIDAATETAVGSFSTCGEGPYTYSDMTGFNLRDIVLSAGTWTATLDSGVDGLEWAGIGWTEELPPGTAVTVRASAMESTAMSPGDWTVVENGAPLEGKLSGRHLHLEVTLERGGSDDTPALLDLTATSVCVVSPETCDGLDNDCDGETDTGDLCPAGEVCSGGACVCAPQCAGKQCGDDGCGGSCGTCPAGEVCSGGACVAPPPPEPAPDTVSPEPPPDTSVPEPTSDTVEPAPETIAPEPAPEVTGPEPAPDTATPAPDLHASDLSSPLPGRDGAVQDVPSAEDGAVGPLPEVQDARRGGCSAGAGAPLGPGLLLCVLFLLVTRRRVLRR